MSDPEISFRKIDWKRAFHLLKREAIRRYKLKYFNNVTYDEGTHNSLREHQKNLNEKIGLFYQTIDDLRRIDTDNNDLHQNDHDINTDSLGKVIIENIVNEIRSPTNSLVSSSREADFFKKNVLKSQIRETEDSKWTGQIKAAEIRRFNENLRANDRKSNSIPKATLTSRLSNKLMINSKSILGDKSPVRTVDSIDKNSHKVKRMDRDKGIKFDSLQITKLEKKPINKDYVDNPFTTQVIKNARSKSPRNLSQEKRSNKLGDGKLDKEESQKINDQKKDPSGKYTISNKENTKIEHVPQISVIRNDGKKEKELYQENIKTINNKNTVTSVKNNFEDEKTVVTNNENVEVIEKSLHESIEVSKGENETYLEPHMNTVTDQIELKPIKIVQQKDGNVSLNDENKLSKIKEELPTENNSIQSENKNKIKIMSTVNMSEDLEDDEIPNESSSIDNDSESNFDNLVDNFKRQSTPTNYGDKSINELESRLDEINRYISEKQNNQKTSNVDILNDSLKSDKDTTKDKIITRDETESNYYDNLCDKQNSMDELIERDNSESTEIGSEKRYTSSKVPVSIEIKGFTEDFDEMEFSDKTVERDVTNIQEYSHSDRFDNDNGIGHSNSLNKNKASYVMEINSKNIKKTVDNNEKEEISFSSDEELYILKKSKNEEDIIEDENVENVLNTMEQQPEKEIETHQQETNEVTEEYDKKDDGKAIIAEDFYYDYTSLISQPIISEESKLSTNTIELYHSFGYDCKKRSNLNILDPETLIFSAGNMVQILNIKTKEQKYLRTTGGGAVGAITVHPSKKYFAVGEKGNMPNINIFEYPSLKLYRVLRQGTVKGYAFLDFNKAGDLLASQGASPDYMLTLWDWKQENVVLRTKAFSQDVYRVTFSKHLKGILTTGGTGHIRFWKMARTFTGYKLQGEIGKFGKTEISDIEGYAELPDGKVLSGSEWGNMLLWDGGLIQTEICRKKGKSCHNGPIQQIILDEGDIYTIGDDGAVRVWDFETIDSAEPSEEGFKLEIEPLNELIVGKNVSLKVIVKDCVEDSSIWYAQDSNGGIWKLDLSFSASSEDPKLLFNYHAGIIYGIDTCPNSHLFTTTADDGSIRVYNYVTQEMVTMKKCSRGGSFIRWLPSSIDSDCATIMTGFQDGVLRFFKCLCKQSESELFYELVLFEAFKPHTKPITFIAIDSKSQFIATGSEDNTVFFFQNKQNRRVPIGFVNLPSKVTYMCWTPEDYKSNRLLVCMADGSVFEYDAPAVGSYDTTKTYLIEMKLNVRKYKFKSIKSRLRHEEELERKRKEEEERKKKLEEERRLRGEDEEDEKKKKKEGEADEEDSKKKVEPEPEQEEESKPKEDEWKPYIPEVPNKINWAYYSSPDTFWLSMDGYDAGYLYECKFLSDTEKTKIPSDKIDEPIGSVAVVKTDYYFDEDIPLTCITLNKSKTHAFIGQKNGLIRYQPMPDTKSLRDLKHYWSYGFHDNEHGRIVHIAMSFDEKLVFSVACDSNIFAFIFTSTPDVLEKLKSEKIRLPSHTDLKEVVDIDDPNAYSIEQEKQKSEHDKMMAEAEAKKKDMRQKIYQLRKTFKDLLTKNDQLMPRVRLGKQEFILEESIKNQVLGQIDEKIKLTYRELAWYSEKCRIALEKVKSRFKDVIDCEHMIVYTFDNEYQVSTFRAVQLPRDVDAFEDELIRQYTIHLKEKQKTINGNELQTEISLIKTESSYSELSTPINSSTKTSRQDSLGSTPPIRLFDEPNESKDNNENFGQGFHDQFKKLFGKLRGNTAARVERALRKMEEKKLKRLKRKKEREELNNARLADGYEDPEDLAVIKFAEDNIGSFKLKTHPNYIVPEEQRMNVFKATRRLIAIKRLLNNTQMIFNKKVIDLRDRKIDLVNEINADIDRLEEIQFMLNKNELKIPERPQMQLEEIPEKKLEYNKEKIMEFKKEYETKSTSMTSGGHEEEGGGFGGFGAGASAPKKVTQTDSISANDTNQGQLLTQRLAGLKPLWHNKDKMSTLMIQNAKIVEVRLIFEQKQILQRICEKISIFDGELKLLRHERSQVAKVLKNIDLRHVTLYEEFMLLREFEKTENELEQKKEKKREENVEMQGKIAEIQTKIDAKKKDIEKLDEQQKQLTETYNQMTKGETKFADFLTKVYKRKIKRKKKLEGEEVDEESEEESDDDDDEDEDEDFDDDDSEAEGREQLDLDICPNGLAQTLFDDVCKLRENRLDLEDKIAEEKKVAEQLKKDQESLVKKSKVIDNGLKQAQQELENFQKEKQKKINDLDIVATMNFNQIQMMEKGYLPADLSHALVFDSRNLDNLQNRIKELQVEKINEKKRFKTLKEKNLELIRDKRKMQEYIERLEETSKKMMVDKFGKDVDLEKLELIAVNQQIEELKQKLAENEFEHEKVMQEWLSKINSQKDESIELLKTNTSRLNEVVDIIKEKKAVEKFLNLKQKSLGDEFGGASKKDIDEQERLQTLVQLQAQEIEALKAEISILSRKGGHILPPSQPPNQVQTV